MKRRVQLAFCASLLAVVGCNNNRLHKIDPDPNKDIKGVERGQPTALAESDNWFTKDPEVSGEEGVGADRFYREIQRNPEAREVIVAVIDSGVDVEHEDLKDNIWNNPGESGLDEQGHDKASNGIDDDGNGYVDDVYGWNFIGGYDEEGKPTHVDYESLEVTRLKKKFDDKVAAGEELSEEDKALHEKVSKEVAENLETFTKLKKDNEEYITKIQPHFDTLKVLLGIDDVSLLNSLMVESLKTQTAEQGIAKTQILEVFKEARTNNVARMQRMVKISQERIDYYYNVDYDGRSSVVGDNPGDFNDVHYGNNDVKGPDAFHGTHVSGIIGAVRGNGVGVDGIAEKVKIMAIRAVPNGDERDKDVALAIRYAVDNGADVINMSFGKAYSPFKTEVDKAMLYAAEKGVLLVHAAGNSSQDNDVSANFPNRFLAESPAGGVTEVSTWVEVGASAAFKGPLLPAVFSNYGNQSVDLFAPGNKLESTIPDNLYSVASGTSMASPSTAGVLALILSERPNLSGVEAKNLLLENVRTYPGLKVNLPQGRGSTDVKQVLFNSLSIFGGVADVFTILK